MKVKEYQHCTVLYETGGERTVIEFPERDPFAVLAHVFKLADAADKSTPAAPAGQPTTPAIPPIQDRSAAVRPVGVRGTSLEAYRKLKASGKISRQQASVLHAMGAQQLTRQELAAKSGLAINAVCGRVHELLELGVLEELDKRTCTVTGERVHELKASAGIAAELANEQQGGTR